MRIGPRPDVMKPDIYGIRTHSNRGFMAFQLVPAAAAAGFGHAVSAGQGLGRR